MHSYAMKYVLVTRNKRGCSCCKTCAITCKNIEILYLIYNTWGLIHNGSDLNKSVTLLMQRKKIFLIRLCSFAVILYTATKKVQFDNLSMGLHWNTKLGLRYLVAVGVVCIPSATKSKYLLVELNNQNTNIG